MSDSGGLSLVVRICTSFMRDSLPTMSLRTAAPPMYSLSFSPDLYSTEAHSWPDATSKPQNITAPYSLAALIIASWCAKYAWSSKKFTTRSFAGLSTRGNGLPICCFCAGSEPICTMSLTRAAATGHSILETTGRESPVF
eukprot:12194_3